MEQSLDKAEAVRAVVGKITGDENIREKLKKYGIEENTSITVIGKISFGGVIVAVDGKNFVLTKTLAENIFLIK
ncbi:MAG: ferrous iron transport protein A [Eubacteriales bacterium]